MTTTTRTTLTMNPPMTKEVIAVIFLAGQDASLELAEMDYPKGMTFIYILDILVILFYICCQYNPRKAASVYQTRPAAQNYEPDRNNGEGSHKRTRRTSQHSWLRRTYFSY
ncbi:hypothetical protein L6164_000387 [Bauhinia variegata]|uniref:Uncharacterized protein n=1 Tax=Bauhinia variegata TaxID=167791 RepID=A0ACB9Q6L1_BAUVA|nr:hypothetical protein L6164_000387 [Bauhinia variegata]